jgi:hypothetical protein
LRQKPLPGATLRPSPQGEGLNRDRRGLLALAGRVVPSGAKLSNPPSQTPLDNFDVSPNTGPRVRIFRLKTNGFRTIIRVDQRSAADNPLASFIKQRAGRQQLWAIGREIITVRLPDLFPPTFHGLVVVRN